MMHKCIKIIAKDFEDDSTVCNNYMLTTTSFEIRWIADQVCGQRFVQ